MSLIRKVSVMCINGFLMLIGYEGKTRTNQEVCGLFNKIHERHSQLFVILKQIPLVRHIQDCYVVGGPPRQEDKQLRILLIIRRKSSCFMPPFSSTESLLSIQYWPYIKYLELLQNNINSALVSHNPN